MAEPKFATKADLNKVADTSCSMMVALVSMLEARGVLTGAEYQRVLERGLGYASEVETSRRMMAFMHGALLGEARP